MQRQTLVPMRDFMRSKGSSNGSGMRLLEVACGTGRFATFIKVCTPFSLLKIRSMSLLIACQDRRCTRNYIYAVCAGSETVMSLAVQPSCSGKGHQQSYCIVWSSVLILAPSPCRTTTQN